MTYTIWDLLAFFLIYSFFGWVIEVGVMARKKILQQGISESSRMSDLRDKSGYTDTDFSHLERKSSDPGSGSDGSNLGSGSAGRFYGKKNLEEHAVAL